MTDNLLTAKQTIQATIDSLDITLQPEQIYAFQAVDKDVFYNYIAAIKTVLKLQAKEWHVVEQLVTYPNHSIYYHVARHDFSEGADHQPIEGLTTMASSFPLEVLQAKSLPELRVIGEQLGLANKRSKTEMILQIMHIVYSIRCFMLGPGTW